MRILVAGAAGFLGSHLCERLLGLGHGVLGVDNLFTGRMRNLDPLLANARFSFVKHDIVEPLEGEFDRVYNLACPASPPHYQADPVATMRTCFLGTLNLLELAQRCSARFFQASTSEIYGDPSVSPQGEDYHGNVNPFGPRACYDEGKRIGETLCFEFGARGKLDIRIARIFNTYGPRMRADDGRVVSNFIVQALRGEDLTVYGDGNQTRSFCYVDDLIDGFLGLMESDTPIRGPVNLGNPVEFRIRELGDMVIEMTSSKSRFVHLAALQDDPKQRRPDISRAMSLLDWSPRIPLRDGLDGTIRYFRGELLAGAA